MMGGADGDYDGVGADWDDNHIALAIPWPGYWRPGCRVPVQSLLTVGQKPQTGHGHRDRANRHDPLHVCVRRKPAPDAPGNLIAWPKTVTKTKDGLSHPSGHRQFARITLQPTDQIRFGPAQARWPVPSTTFALGVSSTR